MSSLGITTKAYGLGLEHFHLGFVFSGTGLVDLLTSLKMTTLTLYFRRP